MITLKDVIDYDFEPFELMAQTSYIFGYGQGRLWNHSTLYTFLDEINESLCAITIALRKHPKKGLMFKPICVHELATGTAFVKNLMEGGGMFTQVTVDWCKEGITKKYYTYYGYKYDKNRITAWEEVYVDAWKKQQLYNYTDTISNPEYLQKTKYKYCGWTNDLHYNLNEFIQLFELYPQLEYFAKMRKLRLAIPSILSLCEKDKNFIKFLRSTAIPEVDNDWRLKPTDIVQAYKHGTNVRTQYNLRDLRSSFRKANFTQITSQLWSKIARYIERNNIDSTLYYDYIVSVINLDLDINDTKNLTPVDFMHWHDIRIAEFSDKQARENERKQILKNKGIEDTAKLYKKIETDGEFYVYMPKTVQEFVNEGDSLHHCVGRMGYADRMSHGDTLILFVRKVEDKTTPYVTMEYNPKNNKIVQVYGDHDTKPQQNVLDFLYNVWKPKADKVCIRVQRRLSKEQKQ